MSGMSATTGRRLDVLSHLRQSIADILSTPLGTRVMRREYGSALPDLVDAPLDGVTVLDIIQATVGAILRWEPRVAVQRVAVRMVGAGRIALDLDLIWRADGGALRLEGLMIAASARTAAPEEYATADGARYATTNNVLYGYLS